jgi:hypothetical protein
VKCLRGPKLIFDPIFIAIALHVSYLASIVVFHCISVIHNLVLRVDSLTIAMVLAELEERGIGSNSGYRSSFSEKF